MANFPARTLAEIAARLIPAFRLTRFAYRRFADVAHSAAKRKTMPFVQDEYHLMMEVPSINQASSDRYQVPCKVKVLHARLSGDTYHIGVTFTEISSLHQNLFEAWLSITTRHDQLV